MATTSTPTAPPAGAAGGGQTPQRATPESSQADTPTQRAPGQRAGYLVAIALNAAFLVYDSRWLRSLGQIGSLAMLVELIRLIAAITRRPPSSTRLVADRP
jgi:hypothetical protein